MRKSRTYIYSACYVKERILKEICSRITEEEQAIPRNAASDEDEILDTPLSS